MESSLEVNQKQESASLADNQSEVYDSSNLGGEDDYMNSLGLYDGYDSYNDSGQTTEEDDSYDTKFVPPGSTQTKGTASQKKPLINGKDGMAKCEQCGSVGVRHAFYSKSKRFCSLSCSRSFATAQREGRSPDTLGPSYPKKGKLSGGRKSKSPAQNVNTVKQEVKQPFDWGPYLVSSFSQAAPVFCFPHVPMSQGWDQMTEGMKLEVVNHDCDLSYNVYWIASVVKLAGYAALMRYEGYGSDSSVDFWINLLSTDLHPVGWCATVRKPLVPPQSIQGKYSDWKEFLVKRLTGARTLPDDFNQVFQEHSNIHRLKVGMKIEVVDKLCVSAMRVANINEIIGGRLRLTYVDSQDEGDDFWCHWLSPLIHHVGWSQTVGHKLHAMQEYRNATLTKIAMQRYDENDVTPHLLPMLKDPGRGMDFTVGMKLEAIDPLNLSSICVATVMKVLRSGYLMIGIDGSDLLKTGSDWFCYHCTSPCIFPVGFCEINNIDLSPPKGYKGTFKWFDYLKATKSVAAPVKLFDKDIPKHGLRPGMKMEAVDLMEPRLVCVATVTRIVGRLLRIHFDGWENEYDQWLDCQSPDVYPVGWCQIMKYPLEGPRLKENVGHTPAMLKKKKTKNQIYKGPRKKRKSKAGITSNPFPAGYRFVSSSLADCGDRVASTPGEKGSARAARPPHVPLPPEAVAANLLPLPGPDLPDPSNKIKMEPLEAGSTQSQHHDGSIPELSPKGGNVPYSKSASELPQGVKLDCTGGAVSGLIDSVNKSNNSAFTNRPCSSVSQNSSSLGSGSRSMLSVTPFLQNKPPESWTAQDVCLFLSINNCGFCSETVLRKNIGGRELLAMSPEEEISLVGVMGYFTHSLSQLLQQLRAYTSKLTPSSAGATSSATASTAMERD